ncbi:MAG TPA: hypothetical protein VJL78_01735 [Candidatus Nitrosocosmicus sp.]|jgi:hypothetical protein|nr:hypothetical protein [Candidatus Nitrosocosmicus sp.]
MLFEKSNRSIIVTIAAVALILAVIPTVVASDVEIAFANSCHNGEHDHNDNDNDNDGNSNSNEAEQEISQEQSSVQLSQVVSGEDSIGSGNNVGLFFNANLGNLALGQQ